MFLFRVAHTDVTFGESLMPKMKRIQQSVMNEADWFGYVCRGMRERFDKVVCAMTIEGDVRKQALEVTNGVDYVVISENVFRKLACKADVVFQRGKPVDYVPPPTRTSLYYAAGARMSAARQKTWTRVLICRGKPSGNERKWVKGVSSDFWDARREEPVYDFVAVGRRGKNVQIIKEVARKYPSRKVAVIGWPRASFKEPNVYWMGIRKPEHIRDVIARSKWAILPLCHRREGFPSRVQLEFAMMGIPCIHNGWLDIDGYYATKLTASRFGEEDFDSWQKRRPKIARYARRKFDAAVSLKSLNEILDEVM